MHPGNIQTWLACGNVLSNIPQTVNKPEKPNYVCNQFVNSRWLSGTAIPKSRFRSVLQTCILCDCMVWSNQPLTQASNFQQLVKCKQRFQNILQYTYSNFFGSSANDVLDFIQSVFLLSSCGCFACVGQFFSNSSGMQLC